MGCGVDAAVVAVEAVVDEAADEDGDDEATVVVEAELAEDPCTWTPIPCWGLLPSPWVFEGADPVSDDEVEFPVLLPPLIGGIRLLIPALLLMLLFVFEVHFRRT